MESTWLNKEFILPMKDVPPAKLRSLKISAREQGRCELVCSLCHRGLRTVEFARGHITTQGHQIKQKERCLMLVLPMLPQPSPSHLESLSELLEQTFQQQSALAQGQEEQRRTIASELQGLVHHSFPDVSVELFGSSASGFALVTSNVNLNLNIPEAQEKLILIPQVMKTILDILHTHRGLYTDVKDDFYSFNKIPRILFKHKTSGLQCEVRTLAGNPMALAPLLALYGSLDQRALKLGVVLRYWAKVCKVDWQEQGHHPSHMFLVMVIHFLQQKRPPVLPSLHQMKEKSLEAVESSHQEGQPPPIEYLADPSEITRRWQCQNTESLGELWFQLLRYYAVDFKVSQHAVTIRQVEPLLRTERHWGTARLAVEDPLIPKSNLARVAGSDKVFTYLLTSLQYSLLYFVSSGLPGGMDSLLQQTLSSYPDPESKDVPELVREEREDHEVEAYSEESDIVPELLEKEGESYDHKQSRGKGGSEYADTTALKEGIHGSPKSSSSKRESAAVSDIVVTAEHDKGSKTHLHASQQSSDHKKSAIVDAHDQVSISDSGEHGMQKERCSKTAEGASALHTDTTSTSELEVFEFPQSESSPGLASDQEIVASVPSEPQKESNKKSPICDSGLPLPPGSPLESPSITADSQRHEGGSIEEEDKSIVFAAFLDTAQLNSKLGISFQRESQLGEPVSERREILSASVSSSELEAAQHCVSPTSITFGSFLEETDLSGLLEKMNESASQQQLVSEETSISGPSPPVVIISTESKSSSDQQKLDCQGQTRDGTTKATSEEECSKATDPHVCVSPPQPNAGAFMFLLENFVFQPYPKACLHCKKLKHIAKDCPEELLPVDLATQLPRTLPEQKSLKAMKDMIKGYTKGVSPKESHLRLRQNVCSSILKDIRKIFPEAKLELFGSSANGFGSCKSDLDLCMTLSGEQEYNKAEVIEAVAAELEKHTGSIEHGTQDNIERGSIWESFKNYQHIMAITSARVPIVKFFLTKLYIECDISLENRLALRNTRMLATYATLDPRVKLLGYTLKRLAKACDMGDAATGSLSSYAYILLLLHYLQRTKPPIIPVLQQLFPGGVKSAGPYIDSWNCYYFEAKSTEQLARVWPHCGKNLSSVGELWLGLLRYFATEFDWTKHVVTIRQLEPLTKFDKWWLSKPMCIEDPFNLDHNLGGAVSSRMRMYILERFVAALCYHSENILWTSMNHLMDEEALVGDSRPPKFMLCSRCNARGHRAQNCPKARLENSMTPNRMGGPQSPRSGTPRDQLRRSSSQGSERRRHKERGQSKAAVIHEVFPPSAGQHPYPHPPPYVMLPTPPPRPPINSPGVTRPPAILGSSPHMHGPPVFPDPLSSLEFSSKVGPTFVLGSSPTSRGELRWRQDHYPHPSAVTYSHEPTLIQQPATATVAHSTYPSHPYSSYRSPHQQPSYLLQHQHYDTYGPPTTTTMAHSTYPSHPHGSFRSPQHPGATAHSFHPVSSLHSLPSYASSWNPPTSASQAQSTPTMAIQFISTSQQEYPFPPPSPHSRWDNPHWEDYPSHQPHRRPR